ncbi:MAG: Transketolase 2 [Gammaproteobacteria bacterium]|nr:Transketolase 2 [Gammaproteobacteria bacterium]
MSAKAEYLISRRRLANAIRALSMDAVQKANSGHPGMPMGMADIAEVLWNSFFKHNPDNPRWADRDRFVLSNGHGSMLHYSLLHLTGYDVPISQLERFRQLHSSTPGHPEYGDTPGIETTTGPLGQGLANAVGMALGEKILAARFNMSDCPIVDHHTYVFLGDGCLMEGISHEACSLAGTLGLGKLIAFWDNNGISIDGNVEGWFTDDTAERFRAYGWHVIDGVDGHESEQVNNAIEEARANAERPSLICCATVIGWGSPNKQGTEATHGAALGEDEVDRVREAIGWEYPPFEIPEDIYAAWDARDRGAAAESDWQDRLDRYRLKYPVEARELERRLAAELPDDWARTVRDYIESVDQAAKSDATRKSSQVCLNAYAPHLPEMIGGSADLTGSNNTTWSGSVPVTAGKADGSYVYFGVREFAMSAIMNGMSLHGGFIPYCGTFLVFSDYARNSLRMAALMGVRNIFVYTHDSIGLGEDGPTHQPVEHAGSLRLIPNLSVWRPCDGVEAAVAWQAAIERRSGPTALLLSRQSVAHRARTPGQIENIARGGYVLVDSDGPPESILIATGSEVDLAVRAARRYPGRVRVVSMPSCDVFDAQDRQYREQVLPSGVGKRIAIEAGVSGLWYKYVGREGRIVGLDRFGESAPAADVFEYLGFTVDRVAQITGEVLTE